MLWDARALWEGHTSNLPCCFSGFSSLCLWFALPQCSLGWNSCINNFVVRKSWVMTLGAPLTPWPRRYIKAQGIAPWSLLEPSCKYTFPSACLCQQLSPDKDCLKNEKTFEPELYQVLASQIYLEDALGYSSCSWFSAFLQGCPPQNILSSCSPALPAYFLLQGEAGVPGAESKKAWWIPSEFVWAGVAGGEIHEEHIHLLTHPVKLHANHPVQSAWYPRGAQKQKSGHTGGCIIHKLYLLQRRGTPSYIFV